MVVVCWKVYPALTTTAGGSTMGILMAAATVLAGHTLAMLRAERIAELARRLAEYPVRLSFLLANVFLLSWITINVATRLGIILLLLAWGATLLAVCLCRSTAIMEGSTILVRRLPVSLLSLYFACALVEVFLRANPMLVGGGGGGNPALTRIYDGLYQKNSYGFRGPEFSIQPSTETFRIVALGDSFTFGQGVPEGQSYPSRLEALLNTECPIPDRRVEVLNAGQSGTDTYEQLERLREKCLSLKPDLVCVQFYMNDLEPRMQATSDPHDLVDRYVMFWAHRSYTVFF